MPVADLWKSDEQESHDICPSLTFQQRIIGFFSMLCLGFLFCILAWVAMFKYRWIQFSIFFTLSNGSAIGGSMFLAGPKKQAKKMFEETRWIATSVYLLSMVMTIVAAAALKSAPLVIICCIFQYLAMIWYGLSYIPFARSAVKNCCKAVV